MRVKGLASPRTGSDQLQPAVLPGGEAVIAILFCSMNQPSDNENEKAARPT